jgi:hypothetical protein
LQESVGARTVVRLRPNDTGTRKGALAHRPLLPALVLRIRLLPAFVISLVFLIPSATPLLVRI